MRRRPLNDLRVRLLGATVLLLAVTGVGTIGFRIIDPSAGWVRAFFMTASATQDRLADRLALHAEQVAIEEKAHAGIIPQGVADVMLEEMGHELRALRASPAGKLAVDPAELLAEVPFFQGVPKEECKLVTDRLKGRTAPAGDAIVKQGETGSSLFLVARGVVRVTRMDGGHDREVATLMAGDFFGEMALLHGGLRVATCRAVTPCALYELRREDIESVLETSPTMQEALEEADVRRREELREGGSNLGDPLR